MERKNRKKSKEPQKVRKNRFLIIFVCIFVSVVLLAGAVVGIIAGVRQAKSAVSFRGINMDSEVASFFVTQYKYNHMKLLRANGIECSDTPAFWAQSFTDGKTYGEHLSESAKNYVAQITVMNYLYDRYAKLSSADKEAIETAVEETLSFKADGSKRLFNEAVLKYGFSYSSFVTAAKMLYKANFAQSIVFGADGSNLKNLSDEMKKYISVEQYLSEYSHVKLLFIRTENTFVLNENGERVEENGGYKIRTLTEEEKQERQALIAEIRGYIAAIGTGEDAMGETMFNQYLSKHDEGSRDMRDSGYYFHTSSEYTKIFKGEHEDIINKSLELSVGEFGEAEYEHGVCFIYKYETSTKDFDTEVLKGCFSDFYLDMSDVLMKKINDEFASLIKFSDRFKNIDVLALPYNYIYVPVFE